MIIDTHCHILWGVDDASKTEEDTIKMLEMAVADGVDVIIATSHIHPKYPANNQQVFHEALLRVQEVIKKHQLPIQVLEGAEVYFDESRLNILHTDACITLNNTDYLLVELPWVHNEDKLSETQIIQAILDAGYHPIIAHPERYEVLHLYPELVDEWIQKGCLMQVNRTSLLGLDPLLKANEFAKMMLKKSQIHLIGSDAHRYYEPRIPIMSDVYSMLVNEIGEVEAKQLCGEKAEAILLNM